MVNFSRFHNKHLHIVRNASRSLRNTAIHKDVDFLNDLFFEKKSEHTKKFNSNLCNPSNEILAELTDYNAFKPDHKKRQKFSIILHVDGP